MGRATRSGLRDSVRRDAWVLAVVALFVAFLALRAEASAAQPFAEPGTYPLSQLPELAQQFAAGVAVPTKFPPGVGQFRIGPGRLNGVPSRAAYELMFEKNGVSLLGFKLDVFRGLKVTAITSSVKTYLNRGGWTIKTSPFTAGPVRGVLQRQSNGGIRFEMYTWASRGTTYVLTTYVLYAGKTQNPWSKTRVIASFKVP